MVWRVLTQPENEPLTLTEVKAHLRVKHSLEDDLIQSLAIGARQHIELVTNRALMPQVWEISLPCFAGLKTPIPGGNLRAIDSVEVDGEEFEGFSVSSAEPPCIYSETWPRTKGFPDSIKIIAQVGYSGAGAIPETLKTAILMLVAHWYDNRQAVIVGNIAQEVPMAVNALLFPYRDMRLI
jgi:uncharacterized phiE125 gp8 family phage protein